MRIFNAKQNAPILLGRRGEHKAEEVLIDVRDFFRDFGAEATFTMFNQLPGEASPYAVATSVEDGVLHWEVSNVDTSKEGAGKAMLYCYVGEQIAKSVIYNTLVEPTLGEAVEPPPAFEPFANRIAEMNAEAQTARREAEKAAEDAEDSANAAADALQELKNGIASGDFKGEPGDPGKDGRDGIDGYTPIKGVDYFDGKDGQNGKDGRNGSDATVTAENVRNAIGFDPANAADLRTQSAEIEALQSTKVGYSEVVNNQLIMYSDSTKEHLLATLDLPTGGGVEDVKIGNNSVVTDGVATIPVAGTNVLGAVKSGTGIQVGTDGAIYTIPASNYYINARTASDGYGTESNNRLVIAPSHLDYAVTASLTDGKSPSWSEEQKAAARERMYAESQGKYELIAHGIVEEAVNSFLVNVNFSEYRKIYMRVFLKNTTTAAVVYRMFVAQYEVTGKISLTYDSLAANNNGFIFAWIEKGAEHDEFGTFTDLYFGQYGSSFAALSNNWQPYSAFNRGTLSSIYQNAYRNDRGKWDALNCIGLTTNNASAVIEAGAEYYVWGIRK